MSKTLIVESHPSFRQTLENIFRSRFPSVDTRTVKDGKHAMQSFETFLPDVILVDVKLSDENGLELGRKVKERYPNIVLILLGSHDLPEYRKAACVSGADYFISKDSPLKEYCTLIEEALSDLEKRSSPAL